MTRALTGRLRASLVGLAWVVLGTRSAEAQAALDSLDRVRLVSAFDLAARIQDSVWPGWSRAPFTVLFVDSTREFLIGAGAPPAGFAPLDAAGLAGRSLASRERQFPPNLLATFPVFGPAPTIVIGSPRATGKQHTAWILTLLHEHFHQLQMADPDYQQETRRLDLARGDTTGMWMLNYPFPYDSNAVERSFAAAARRLAEALRSPSVPGRATFWQHYGDLVGGLSVPDQRYLAFQLWQEGVARYVELRSAAEASRLAEPTAPCGSSPGCESFAAAASRLHEAILADLDAPDLRARRRVSFYAFGAGMALLLDQSGPAWRQAYLARKFVLAAESPADSVARLILELDRVRFAADLRADAAALDSLLADDVTYVRSSGAVDGKVEYLRSLGATGPYALDSLVPADLSVRVFSEAAVVTGRLIVKLRAQPAPYAIRFTDVWVRRRGRWQLVAFQATRLP